MGFATRPLEIPPTFLPPSPNPSLAKTDERPDPGDHIVKKGAILTPFPSLTQLQTQLKIVRPTAEC